MTDCTAVPQIIDALLVIVEAAVDTTVKVFDGPYPKLPAGDFVCVGWSPFDDASTGTGDYATTARGRNEDFTVPVYVSTYGKASTYKALRDRAKALGDVVSSALHTTPNVGGIVGWAGVRAVQLYQQPSENGPAVGLVLHVQGTARI